MTRVLVVEDNADLAFAVTTALQSEGFDVVVAGTGPEGVDMARTDTDLIILDLMLPGFDGFRVIRTLREEGIVTPILILSARGEEADKVKGLRLGADDYVTKPFGAMELLARVDALLRRAKRPATPAAMIDRFGDVEVNRAARTVKRRGEPVALAPKELDLLIALMDRAGAVVPRGELLSAVWGYQGDISTRTVDIHVSELRAKLEQNPAQPVHIITVRKAGYRFEA